MYKLVGAMEHGAVEWWLGILHLTIEITSLKLFNRIDMSTMGQATLDLNSMGLLCANFGLESLTFSAGGPSVPHTRG